MNVVSGPHERHLCKGEGNEEEIVKIRGLGDN